ncbi:MAG: helicase-related protein [Pirellula sp.]
MSQPQRDEVFKALRENKLDILVATDVVGRGIDVSSISHIINYDLPDECDDYVHRVGRTGRMGRSGIAFSFVSKDQGYMLTEIEQRINRMLEKDPLSEIVGKRREPSSSVDSSRGSASETATNESSSSESSSSDAATQAPAAQEPIEADLPFGSAPARRTLGRAKSRGSVRKR